MARFVSESTHGNPGTTKAILCCFLMYIPLDEGSLILTHFEKKDSCPADANVVGVFENFFMYIYKKKKGGLDKSGL